MTRDELIAGTRQLVDEGDRLRANPSLPSLQMWLQRSDDLLATAWGSMDRYHLAWLMVGKPKGIVRGRPMTRRRGGRLRPRGRRAEDRGPADEPRCRRAPGDAVRRRVGRGRAGRIRARHAAGVPIARRIAPAFRPTRHCPSGWPRRDARPRRTSTMRSSCAASRQDAAVTERVPAAARGRCRPRTRSRATILLGLRLDQHIPGLVDGYFGPADLKARVDLEQLRPPARCATTRMALRQRLPAEVDDPARRVWRRRPARSR